jgi:hypothetical protein
MNVHLVAQPVGKSPFLTVKWVPFSEGGDFLLKIENMKVLG